MSVDTLLFNISSFLMEYLISTAFATSVFTIWNILVAEF